MQYNLNNMKCNISVSFVLFPGFKHIVRWVTALAFAVLDGILIFCLR